MFMCAYFRNKFVQEAPMWVAEHTCSCITHANTQEAEQINNTHTYARYSVRMCMKGGVARTLESGNDLGQQSVTSSLYCIQSDVVCFSGHSWKFENFTSKCVLIVF
ncbi:hypothetical protein XENORESO_000222 [Xenotaenia resolanae]|uniref:Uncharacterized protein n=1 Tax=Xenotaenia resolanae TaxID=208358 RepID=A0ABV0WD29_9TELE